MRRHGALAWLKAARASLSRFRDRRALPMPVYLEDKHLETAAWASWALLLAYTLAVLGLMANARSKSARARSYLVQAVVMSRQRRGDT